MSEPIVIREVVETDVDAIREIFMTCYGENYSYPDYYEQEVLKGLIYDRDVIFLAAEDTDEERILGTASVILDIGAWGDLIGEFGRLAVHPDGRGRGIGNRLMEGRLERVKDRLHIAVVENRAVHSFSQKISDRYGFVPAGFLPSKRLTDQREHVALYARHFGDALKLRRNHPRIIPEVWPLADQVLGSCGLESDAIIDNETASYGMGEGFEVEEMTSAGYTSLLHFERGRVRHREILGPVKLSVGLFLLRVSHYEYLLAKQRGHLFGGVGYFVHQHEKTARILELVSSDARPVRFMLEEVMSRLQDNPDVKYVEVDVSAHATSMQRTFLELGFSPVAYIPAMSFHRVERLDGIRMVKLYEPFEMERVNLHEATRPVADLVIDLFQNREVVPRIVEAVSGTTLFQGLNDEQASTLASLGRLEEFAKGTVLFEQGSNDGRLLLLLAGEVEIEVDGNTVGKVAAGDSLGELSILKEDAHHVTATATAPLETAVFEREAISTLIRRRPDIGVIVFRNLATELGAKLLRKDRENVGEPGN